MSTHNLKRPDSVAVRSLLADGGVVTVTATRRPRGGRAGIKCSAPAAPAVAARMAQVARLARHTEARHDSRDQVVISMDRAPGAQERDWELAVVLADRMVRGLAPALPGAGVVANGWSGAWERGRVEGHDLRGAPPGTLLGGAGLLHHLGALTGQPDVADSVSSARAWFPLHSGGIHDALCWVEVSVYPLAGPAAGADDELEDMIAAPGLDGVRQAAVRQALAGARHFDGQGGARWRTTVRFGADSFHGNSYELALVLADRIARGREFIPRGRIVASGCSSAWHAGQVEPVEGLGPKCALIAREARAGDRVLLPRAWETALPAGLAEDLKRRGASLACIDRIGII